MSRIGSAWTPRSSGTRPSARLLTERYPWLYGFSVSAHRLGRVAEWILSRRRHARLDTGVETSHRVVRHGSQLMRRLGDVDMSLQRNKVQNLRLAILRLDGRILRPGDELSFWRCVGRPSARRGYLEGLVLVHGRMASDVGGGLCQLSNLLYWMVLHTTMTVVERHHHGYDPFPDSGRVVPFGSGATVFYNYVDLRFINPGPETYRIRLWLTDDELRGELLADRLPPTRIHIHEQGHRFFRAGGRIYRENRLVRTMVDRRTGRPAGHQLVTHNVCPVLYEPGPGVVVEDEASPRVDGPAVPVVAAGGG